MAIDVRLTTRQALAIVDLVAKVEQGDGNRGIRRLTLDGNALRVLKNAALRIGAGLALDAPDSEATSRARGIALRELVKQLREIDRGH